MIGTAARLAAAILLGWALLHPRPALAQIRAVAMPVSGMTCMLCTRGVAESIRRLETVARVHVDLSTGRVTVEAVEARSLNLQRVGERVVQAGFAVDGEFDVVAVGRFALGAGRRFTFRIGGEAKAYQVLENYATLNLFKNHPDLKGEFLAAFRLHTHRDWKRDAIAITKIEPWTGPGPRP